MLQNCFLSLTGFLCDVTEALMIFNRFFLLNQPEVDLRWRQEFVTYNGGW